MATFSRILFSSTTNSSTFRLGRLSRWILNSEFSFRPPTVPWRTQAMCTTLRLPILAIHLGVSLGAPPLIIQLIWRGTSTFITVQVRCAFPCVPFRVANLPSQQERFGPSKVAASRTTSGGVVLHLHLTQPAHHPWWRYIRLSEPFVSETADQHWLGVSMSSQVQTQVYPAYYNPWKKC